MVKKICLGFFYFFGPYRLSRVSVELTGIFVIFFGFGRISQIPPTDFFRILRKILATYARLLERVNVLREIELTDKDEL